MKEKLQDALAQGLHRQRTILVGAEVATEESWPGRDLPSTKDRGQNLEEGSDSASSHYSGPQEE